MYAKILPAGIYLRKVNNKSTRARCEICSKLTIKTPEWRQCGYGDVVLVSFMLTLNKFYTLFWCFCCELWHLIAGWTINSINARSINHKISFCAQSYQCMYQCGVTNIVQGPLLLTLNKSHIFQGFFFNLDFEYGFYLFRSCLVDSKGMIWKIFSYINVLLQKQPPEVFYERCSSKFTKFTRKHLCQSLFLI